MHCMEHGGFQPLTWPVATDWQVKLAPEDREKTAFTTPYGLYQFCVMPFGLCNAPSTFQRLMELVLAGLHWSSCLVYLDDIIIYSRTVKEHLMRLEEVLKRLQAAGMKLKPKKCRLLRREVIYLGYIVSSGGVQTDPLKVECILSWPSPTTQKELRQFLGLASYYRRFAKGFASIAPPPPPPPPPPLNHLLEKGISHGSGRKYVSMHLVPRFWHTQILK